MTSKIDPSGINPAYPVASTNQSSQGFRDNFKAIQNALVQAKTENTLILGTTISISGDGIDDFTSTSIEVGNGNIPLEINLSTQSNVNSASYNTLTDIISFTVNQQGLLTSLSKQPSLPVTDTTGIWKITRTPNDASYPGQNGILSFTYPTIQTNEAGRVTSTGSVTVSQLGLLGYAMTKGQLLVGSSSNLSTYLPVGQDKQVLVANSGSPSGLSWTTPTNGTVTNVTTGLGLLVNNSNVTPEIDLDIQALPDNNTFSDTLIFLSYDQHHSTTKWTNLKTQLTQLISATGFLTKVQDDPSPVLGGDLNTGGHNITTAGNAGLTVSSGSGGLTLNSTGPISSTGSSISLSSPSTKLNGITIPGNLPSADNMVLTANTDGVLYWQAIKGVASITGDKAILVNTVGSTVGLGFSPWRLPDATINSNTRIIGVDTGANSSGLVDITSIVQGASVTPGMIFVSPQGDDTNGNGSMISPYATITTAMTKGTTICLLPGSYSENLTTTNIISLSSLIQGAAMINSAIITNSAGSSYNGLVFMNTVSVPVTSTFNNCDFRSTIDITGNGMFYTCSFAGNITTAGNMIADSCDCVSHNCTITSSANIEITNSSGLTFVHNGGDMELYNIVYCGGITSTSSSSSDTLTLRNVSLSNNDGTWNVLNKTGTCPYIIQNVSRLSSQDTLSGNRLEFANTDDDIGDQYVTATITGDYSITNNNRIYDITVNTASSFTITMGVDEFNTDLYIRSMTVILRGTSTSAGFGTNTITWNGVTWTGGVAPGWNFADGKVTVLTFLYIKNVGWLGSPSIVTV